MGAQGQKLSRYLRSAAAALAFLALAGCSNDTPATLNHVDTHELFNEAYRQISDYYIEPTTPERLGLAGLAKLTTLDSSVAVERQGDQIVVQKSGTIVARFDAPTATDSWDWGGVTASALDAARHASPRIASTSEDDLDKLVMDGAISTLDRFSRYATPSAAREQRAERNGFDGIGVTLEPDETQVRILSVLPDGPAEHAGIKPDDRIITIDGAVASTLTRDQVVMRLRGAAGTRVVIGIERPGVPQPITLSVNRAHIVLPTVILKLEGHVAIIRITSFNQETYEQLIEALAKARREFGAPPAGIVLDLRDNPGGLLDQSVKVASIFLHGGIVVSTVGRRRESRREYSAESTRAIDGIPLVVLINGGSASASEIVASSLQDRGRAVVIGTSSFGKGTVQTVLELLNDGELTVTWAKLVTPEGYILHEHGVVPTLCTADLGDDDGSVTKAIQQGSTTGTGLSGRPRIALDDKGWTELRGSCPAQRVDRSVDLKIAERLLQDPVLYTRVLNAMPIEAARTAAAQP
ncbi:MAG TPA: S41 family peptidase [Stellaceae bacterium]|nr:S41 family peptidase [Stellaceae bacterium]